MQKITKISAVILVFAVLVSGIISMTAIAAQSGNGVDEDAVPSSGKEKTDGEKRSGGKSKGVHVNVLSVAASVLGIDKAEIKETIKDGKVGDLLIAADKVDDFKIAYLSELKSKLDAAVKTGTLTQEQADKKYESEKNKMDNYDGTTHLCGNDHHAGMFDETGRGKNRKPFWKTGLN